MLILTRKPGEAIRIGDDITITVLDVKGSNVRVGIDAPKAVPVHRQEVYARIRSELREPYEPLERDELRKVVGDQPGDAKDS